MTTIPQPSLESLIQQAVAAGVAQALAEFKPVTEEPDEVLNTAKAAKLLGVDQATVRAEAEAGRLPGLVMGNGWKFSKRALLGVLQKPQAKLHMRKAGAA